VARSPAADEPLILAALLHDIVEDTSGTADQIEARFGAEVAALVLEVTDDKSLPKQERKRRQEATVAAKTEGARRIKLADKASNLTALAESPPAHWDAARRAEYVDWAERVIARCRGIDPVLEAAFEAAVVRARAALGVAA
jgi:(p)ppGpp synthase/HD superfamily hydrolase